MEIMVAMWWALVVSTAVGSAVGVADVLWHRATIKPGQRWRTVLTWAFWWAFLVSRLAANERAQRRGELVEQVKQALLEDEEFMREIKQALLEDEDQADMEARLLQAPPRDTRLPLQWRTPGP